LWEGRKDGRKFGRTLGRKLWKYTHLYIPEIGKRESDVSIFSESRLAHAPGILNIR
jgi:hypothetical protein